MKLTLTVLFSCVSLYCNHLALSLPTPFNPKTKAILEENAGFPNDKIDHNALKASWLKKDQQKEIRSNYDLISQNNKSNNKNKKNGQKEMIVLPSAENDENLKESFVSNMRVGSTAFRENDDQSRQLLQDAYDLDDFTDVEDEDATPDEYISETNEQKEDDINLPVPFLEPQILKKPTVPDQISNRDLRAQDYDDTYFTPLKFWRKNCKKFDSKNCQQKHQRGNLAGSNNVQFYDGYDDSDKAANDILTMMNSRKNLARFVNWAMHSLSPKESFHLPDTGNADSFYWDSYLWKKLNASGKIEPPLLVEEPHYLIVRREKLPSDELNLNVGGTNPNDPFIPPRGRKHNTPDLEALLHRHETFVPNRGKKNKLDNLLFNDDPFYPNRGKKDRIKDFLQNEDIFFPNRGKKDKIKDLLLNEDLFFPNRGKKDAIKELLQNENDLFFPNRGKKAQIKDSVSKRNLFFMNHGKKDQIADLLLNDDLFFPNRGRRDKINEKLLKSFIFFPSHKQKMFLEENPFSAHRLKKDRIKELILSQDIFYPNRGRRYLLNDTLSNNDVYYPNRGKKESIKDILLGDDLFYPNRGKKDNLGEMLMYDELFSLNHGNKQNKEIVTLPTSEQLLLNPNDVDNEMIDPPSMPSTSSSPLMFLSSPSSSSLPSVFDHGLLSSKIPKKLAQIIAIQGMLGKLKSKLQQHTNKQHQRQLQQLQTLQLLEQMQQTDEKKESQQKRENFYLNDHLIENSSLKNKNRNSQYGNDKRVSSNNNGWMLPYSKMSTHKINGYDQSVKQSMSPKASGKTIGKTFTQMVVGNEMSTPSDISKMLLAKNSSPVPRTSTAGSNYGWKSPALLQWHSPMELQAKSHDTTGKIANRSDSNKSISTGVYNNDNAKAAKQVEQLLQWLGESLALPDRSLITEELSSINGLQQKLTQKAINKPQVNPILDNQQYGVLDNPKPLLANNLPPFEMYNH